MSVPTAVQLLKNSKGATPSHSSRPSTSSLGMPDPFSSRRIILVIGATGRQGRATVAALCELPIARAELHIVAVTRNPFSDAALALRRKHPMIELFEGDYENDLGGLFDNLPGTPEAMFSVLPVTLGKAYNAQREIQLGQRLHEAAIDIGVKHIVYSSIDRHGNDSDTTATKVPHFDSKWEIEQHLAAECARSSAQTTWTVLRPVTFFDNLTPDIAGRVAAATIGKCRRPQQMVAVRDVGWFAARALTGYTPANPSPYAAAAAAERRRLEQRQKAEEEAKAKAEEAAKVEAEAEAEAQAQAATEAHEKDEKDEQDAETLENVDSAPAEATEPSEHGSRETTEDGSADADEERPTSAGSASSNSSFHSLPPGTPGFPKSPLAEKKPKAPTDSSKKKKTTSSTTTATLQEVTTTNTASAEATNPTATTTDSKPPQPTAPPSHPSSQYQPEPKTTTTTNAGAINTNKPLPHPISDAEEPPLSLEPLNPYAYLKLSLAGDELTLPALRERFYEKMGYALPEAYGWLGGGALWMSRELSTQYAWLGRVGYGASLDECRRLKPDMLRFAQWVEKHSEFTRGAEVLGNWLS